MQDRYILLIFQKIPEEIEVYLFPVSHEDADIIRKCHGAFINGESPEDVQDALYHISEKLCDENGVNHYDNFLAYDSRNHIKEVMLGDLKTLELVISGILL